MSLPNDTQSRLQLISQSPIVILEGVSGVGKSTFREYLSRELGSCGKSVFAFSEEELLFSYKHVAIAGIEHIRFDLYDALLKQFSENLTNLSDTVIILERFHLSAKVVSWHWDESLEARFHRISQQLADMSAHVCLMTLAEEQFLTRHTHSNRGKQWEAYLEKKKDRFGVASIDERVRIEQEKFISLTKNCGTTYSIIPAHSFPAL